MNLQEQIGALETGVDQLIQSVTTVLQREGSARPEHVNGVDPSDGASDVARDTESAYPATDDAPTDDIAAPAGDEKPTLHIERPNQNEITMTIGGKSVTLQAPQIGQLIEELSNARASMQPEVSVALPAGWRFVSTRNPVMAVQKQSNGDRLLVMRHTGHGWVPFQFSPDMVIQMYMMLTQK